MSILAMHEGQAAAAAPDYIAPPKPEPKFNWAGVATALPYGVAEAGMQVLGSVADIGAGLAYYRDTPSKDMQAGVPAEAFRSDLGDALRDRGREFRPDPQTASTAENLIFGFARGASKIVAGAMVAGPLGVVAAGGEEAMTQSDELRRQGVGLEARNKAGLVQGAGLGLAALPLVGQTLKATAALYVAGGPGGYMAQQALTREILRNAGHDQIAAQYDPFDPVGLAVASLIPAGFAAWGIRGQRMAAAAKAAEDFRTGPVPSEVSPVADAVRQAYSHEVVDAARVMFSVERTQRAEDIAMQYAQSGQRVESLSDFLAREKIKPEAMPPEVNGDFLGFIRGAGGIDFAQKYDISGERNGVRLNPAGIFRKGGRPTDELAMLAEEAGYLRPGQGQDSGAFVDMVQAAIRGERVLTMAEQMQQAARNEVGASMVARLDDVESRLRLLGIDPAPAGGNVAALEAFAARHEPQILAAALDEVAADRAAGEVSPEYAALQDRARGIAQDMQDGGRTLEQYEAEVAPLSPVMRRLVGEAMKEPPRAAEPTQAANPEGTAPGGDAATAPGVPGTRPAAAEAAGLTPGASAETAAAAARIEGIRAQHPDLMVQIDGMDAPMRMDDFLKVVKAEADEMAADAPLMEVAAQCALLNGP